MGSHQSAKMQSDTWLTPPNIIKSLGEFDLDPCSPINRPWDTAKHHYTIEDNGLIQKWFGRIWLNPPYGLEAAKWLNLLSEHGNGIALIFARTETQMFFEHVWNKASSLLFLEGRLHFYDINGIKAKANAGAPSVLIAYGNKNVDSLEQSDLPGAHVIRNYRPALFVGIDYTWRKIITIAIEEKSEPLSVSEIYKLVEATAPAKVRNNSNYKAKIRQQLQQYFCRVSRAHYSLA